MSTTTAQDIIQKGRIGVTVAILLVRHPGELAERTMHFLAGQIVDAISI